MAETNGTISNSHINTTKSKLSPKYFAPYKINEQIGSVAYPLELPSDIRIHNVFRVSPLMEYRGLPLSTPPPLPTMHEGAAVVKPKK